MPMRAAPPLACAVNYPLAPLQHAHPAATCFTMPGPQKIASKPHVDKTAGFSRLRLPGGNSSLSSSGGLRRHHISRHSAGLAPMQPPTPDAALLPEGRIAVPLDFDWRAYLIRYPDLRVAGIRTKVRRGRVLWLGPAGIGSFGVQASCLAIYSRLLLPCHECG